MVATPSSLALYVSNRLFVAAELIIVRLRAQGAASMLSIKRNFFWYATTDAEDHRVVTRGMSHVFVDDAFDLPSVQRGLINALPLSTGGPTNTIRHATALYLYAAYMTTTPSNDHPATCPLCTTLRSRSCRPPQPYVSRQPLLLRAYCQQAYNSKATRPAARMRRRRGHLGTLLGRQGP